MFALPRFPFLSVFGLLIFFHLLLLTYHVYQISAKHCVFAIPRSAPPHHQFDNANISQHPSPPLHVSRAVFAGTMLPAGPQTTRSLVSRSDGKASSVLPYHALPPLSLSFSMPCLLILARMIILSRQQAGPPLPVFFRLDRQLCSRSAIHFSISRDMSCFDKANLPLNAAQCLRFPQDSLHFFQQRSRLNLPHLLAPQNKDPVTIYQSFLWLNMPSADHDPLRRTTLEPHWLFLPCSLFTATKSGFHPIANSLIIFLADYVPHRSQSPWMRRIGMAVTISSSLTRQFSESSYQQRRRPDLSPICDSHVVSFADHALRRRNVSSDVTRRLFSHPAVMQGPSVQ